MSDAAWSCLVRLVSTRHGIHLAHANAARLGITTTDLCHAVIEASYRACLQVRENMNAGIL